jgi:HD-GYP domain-containing protein (c-di-GMP phosphodiesterase class II)
MSDWEITSLSSLAMSLSAVLDMVSPRFASHHQRTAFIAYQIGLEMNLPFQDRKDLLLAGSFHDIGMIAPLERLGASARGAVLSWARAEVGYRLLREFEPFARAAEIVRYQYGPWKGGGDRYAEESVPLSSCILHLADYVATRVPDQRLALGKAGLIREEIERDAGVRFHPDVAEAFLDLSRKEFFWLDAAAATPVETIQSVIEFDSVELDADTLIDLGQLFSRIIDFRSHFTATHSSGVSNAAGLLSEYADFSLDERLKMRLAGYLHDLGKLAVPTAIIEKPGPLSATESEAMRAHSYFGFRSLQKTTALATVNEWGSLHHERLDGSGYPFHLTKADIPLGSRIMAVADVLTALSEERPYRTGMRAKDAFSVLSRMGHEGTLDSDIVELAGSHLAEIEARREESNSFTLGQYNSFLADITEDLAAARPRSRRGVSRNIALRHANSEALRAITRRVS